MQMKSFGLTDIGKIRKVNQDFIYVSDQPVGPLPNLYIVADGMGGHNAGDFASRHAVETIVDCISHATQTQPVYVMREAVDSANAAVYAKSISRKELEGMGTTLVIATVKDSCLYVANVGDSRLYLIDDEITQITYDHSLVEEMVRKGELTREQARNHPEKNIITRAVGVRGSLQVDFFDVALEAGDKFLLCSDGLSNMVTDKQICNTVIESASLAEAVKRLIEDANRNGGSDNISIVLAESEE